MGPGLPSRGASCAREELSIPLFQHCKDNLKVLLSGEGGGKNQVAHGLTRVTPGDKEVAAAAAAKPLQSCLTLSDPRSPSGSSDHGIFQARTLEWGAIAFSE